MPVRFECQSELGLNDLHTETGPRFKDCRMTINLEIPGLVGSDRVVRWCWVSFQCRGVLLIWIMVGQGPSALAVGAGGVAWTFFFTRLSFPCSFSLSGRRPDIDPID